MSDKYYTSFIDYFNDNNPEPDVKVRRYRSFGRSISRIVGLSAYKSWIEKKRSETQEYNKQMELQKTELNTLRSGQPKTVNYGTAISVDDITKSGIEADDDRARAAALEQLEKERLGANIVSMGQTSLLRGLK